MSITRSITRALTQPLTRPLTDPGVGGGAQLVAVPAGFGWTPPVNVYKQGGVYTTDYDPTPFLVEGDPGVTTYYVDADTGNEANPGTSASPKASLRNISVARTTKLLIKARGTFYTPVTANVFTASDNLCVVAWGGAPLVITTETAPSNPWVWTDEGGGVWSAPSPNAGLDGIVAYSGTDVDNLTYYPPQASLAACQALAGSSFRDTSSGIKHYIHTLTGASPATGHTIYGGTYPAQAIDLSVNAYPQRIQFHGASFRGGAAALFHYGHVTNLSSLELINCSFKHATDFAAFNVSYWANTICYQCTAGPTRFDGFGYTTLSGGTPNAVEIGCTAMECGVESGANQGSTAHLGSKILRVGGSYYGSANDQIADVNAGTRSWNLGLSLGPKGIASGFAGVACGNGDDPTVWLDGCTFAGLDYDVYASTAGGFIYYRNMPAPNANPATVGTVATY